MTQLSEKIYVTKTRWVPLVFLTGLCGIPIAASVLASLRIGSFVPTGTVSMVMLACVWIYFGGYRITLSPTACTVSLWQLRISLIPWQAVEKAELVYGYKGVRSRTRPPLRLEVCFRDQKKKLKKTNINLGLLVSRDVKIVLQHFSSKGKLVTSR